ncbi:MFS transporter [Sphingomonas jatrophae]|uniref:Predicted arabinose efflux permease, MFS family n=1 Tax=Sphingomonas jatrophae TaxID=1166337 RepID=A0A1I6JLG1_9SPHN|nr:MFS transporter [Sphingomonas jatrophae]SFR79400.1 Predicted arabinose efflux permease, MFS family [Sphingomonas jatrophae]
MQSTVRLLGQRRFLPLFLTQFLNAFNDNLFKTAMVILVTFTIYNDPEQELFFSAVAGGLFILPFFLFSTLSGQLADSIDKTRIIRFVKSAEIVIMVGGAAGLLLHSIPLMLTALFAMGVHSTFFGPIKYAILPQHLEPDEVLGGTGLVEATTYGAVLIGTIVGGLVSPHAAAAMVVVTAIIGRLLATQVPPAPPEPHERIIDFRIIRSSIALISATMHVRHLFLAIVSISFFWAQGAILAAQFPPLVKNVLGSDKEVATLFLAIFSVGVAIGSVVINKLLAGKVSARWSPAAALVMGLFLLDLWWTVSGWPAAGGGRLLEWSEFIVMPRAERVLFDLFGVAVFGGIFVVPLYAFLTTSVPKDQTARTVAANNIVNSGAMVGSTVILAGLVHVGVTVAQTMLLVAVMSIGAAALARMLHRACD